MKAKPLEKPSSVKDSAKDNKRLKSGLKMAKPPVKRSPIVLREKKSVLISPKKQSKSPQNKEQEKASQEAGQTIQKKPVASSPQKKTAVTPSKTISSPTKRLTLPSRNQKSPGKSDKKSPSSSSPQKSGEKASDTASKSPPIKPKSKTTLCAKSRDPLKRVKQSVKTGRVKSKAKALLAHRNKPCREKLDFNEFNYLMAIASIGKREASLNASMKMNILYESQKSPIKSSQDSPSKLSPKKLDLGEAGMSGNSQETSSKKSPSASAAKTTSKASISPNMKANHTPKEKLKQKEKKSEPSKKRKSPDSKTLKVSPPGKSRKVAESPTKSKTQTAAKSKKKPEKAKRKKTSYDTQLSNIIERSPRQASLMAKAMIAMEQEEETVQAQAARARFYDWTELRTLIETNNRRFRWMTGLGPSGKERRMRIEELCPELALDNAGDSSDRTSSQSTIDSEALHTTLLKTLHYIGDARLLREYLRAQKEDTPGPVDVETCPVPDIPAQPTPTTPLKNTKVSNSSASKKKPTTPSTPEKSKKTSTPNTPDKKKTVDSPDDAEKSRTSLTPTFLEKGKVISPPSSDEKSIKSSESSGTHSPAKPQPCRVATPIPQFPAGQRASHMTSFIHHPIPQSMYPSHQQPAHQPIKVTPYTPNPTYIYQYSLDRQQGMYIPPPNQAQPQSTLPYPDSTQGARDYSTSSFAINPMGNLGLGRRSMNPYQPTPHYNPTIHMPVQQVGPSFNIASFYPGALPTVGQQNLGALQSLPLHTQQFGMVPQPVISQHPFSPQGQVGTYSPYPQYPAAQMASGVNPEGMPPPAPPPAHSNTTQKAHHITPIRPQPVSHPSLALMSPIESLRSMNPAGVQAISKSPALKSALTSGQNHPNSQINPTSSFQFTSRDSGTINIQPFSSNMHTIAVNSPSKSVPVCKREVDNLKDYESHSRRGSPLKVGSGATKASEGSNVSDLLHSAHSTVYEEEAPVTTMDNMRNIHQPYPPASIAIANGKDSSPLKNSTVVSIGDAPFNYSVSSILDMPTQKVKAEIEPPSASCILAKSSPIKLETSAVQGLPSPQNAPTILVCFATPATAGPSSEQEKQQSNDEAPVNRDACNKKADGAKETVKGSVGKKRGHEESFSGKKSVNDVAAPAKKKADKDGVSAKKIINEESVSVKKTVNEEEMSVKKKVPEVIVIDDSTDSASSSSDDEPLSKLVKSKTDNVDVQKGSNAPAKSQTKPVAVSKEKTIIKKTAAVVISKPKVSGQGKKLEKPDVPNQPVKSANNVKTCKTVKPNQPEKAAPKPHNSTTTNNNSVKASPAATVSVVKLTPIAPNKPKSAQPKVVPVDPAKAKPSTAVTATKRAAPKPKKTVNPKKSRIEPPPMSMTPPRATLNHGWSWVGEGEMKPIPKLTVHKEEPVRIRKCYRSMRHSSGETISVRDCVILQSDGDGSVPYVGKVSALWETPTGEMMFSMLWFYQPEHTARGREPEDGEMELFASKHREENSVACIDDKCYVLLYNEYCRLEAEAVRQEQGVPMPVSRLNMPAVSAEDRNWCRPQPPPEACLDNIWFCRYDYDIRKKVVRKPKHKSNLRFRSPIYVNLPKV